MLPISTNFVGIQKRLVPKCLLIDIYDLEFFTNTSILELTNKLQTLCVLAAGSIITNITLTSSKPYFPADPDIPNNKFLLSILYLNGSVGNQNLVNFPLIQIDLSTQNNVIGFIGIGKPLPSNGQIVVIFSNDKPVNSNSVIPYLQFLIEYLSEEQ